MQENNGIVVETKSTILNEEQVNNIVNKGETTTEENSNNETILPSDESSYNLPEKYAGKSAEELYKLMKVEEEFNKGRDKSKEEVNTEEVVVPQNIVEEFTNKFKENGGELTEQDYKELEEKGYNKDFVDNYKAGIEAKQLKEVNDTFTAVNVTQEQFQEAGKWARDNWSEDRVTEYNEAMNEAFATNNQSVKKALIRSLIDASTGAPKENAKTFHSNQPTSQPQVKGYSTKSEFFKDSQDNRYLKDRSYRELVEKKYLNTDRSNW